MTATSQRRPIDLFAEESAVALRGDALRDRFGASAVNRAVSRGALVRLLPNVYAAAAHAQSFHVRAQAASIWANAPISGVAALYLWGLVPVAPDRIEVTIDQTRKLHPPVWVKVRRVTTKLPSRDGATPVMSPAAAIVLGYGLVHKDLRAEVVYGAIRRKLASVQQLRSVLASIPRVKARASLEKRIAAAAVGAQSYLEEYALREVFNTQEFDRLKPQWEVVIEGNQFFLDLFDPATKTAIELDGKKGHTDAARQKNIARDCWVATIGILTLRFSYWDITERPEWCRRVVREVLAHRNALQERAKVRNRS